jgi:hypothetical protein
MAVLFHTQKSEEKSLLSKYLSLNGKSKEEFEQSVRMDRQLAESEIVSLFSYSETPSQTNLEKRKVLDGLQTV